MRAAIPSIPCGPHRSAACHPQQIAYANRSTELPENSRMHCEPGLNTSVVRTRAVADMFDLLCREGHAQGLARLEKCAAPRPDDSLTGEEQTIG